MFLLERCRHECGHTNQWLWSSHRNKNKNKIPNVMPQTDNSSAERDGVWVLQHGTQLWEKFPEQDAEFLIWNQMPADDSTASMWSDTFRNHRVRLWSMLLPALYPPSATPFMSWCGYHGCLLHRHSVIPPRSVHFSKSPTGHPSWKPKAKTPGLSKVCIFSTSLGREVQF